MAAFYLDEDTPEALAQTLVRYGHTAMTTTQAGHKRTMRYRSQARDQSPLRQRIKELAAVRVRYGYRRMHILLRREGWRVNAKRVYRLYREEGLSLRLKRPKKRVSVPRVTCRPPRDRTSGGASISCATASPMGARSGSLR